MMKKLLLVVVILFLGGSTIVCQTENNNQTITISDQTYSLLEILDQITKQTDFRFSYNSKAIDPDQKVSLPLSQVGLIDGLDALSAKVGLNYKIVSNIIILTKAERKEDIEPYTLSGYITDKTTGESLIGATVFVPDTNIGAVTNAFGYYALPLKPGDYQLAFSYVGFEENRASVSLKGDSRQSIALSPISIALPNVIVDQHLNCNLVNAPLGHMPFSPKALQNMPEFAGESGLLKGLQSLPGVPMHSDGSAFFYIRGGERDQNLIIIDDAPIYNPAHLFGFYSVVIPDFAKSINVYKSDMPTYIGDRLSSIVSIRTKDGNLKKIN